MCKWPHLPSVLAFSSLPTVRRHSPLPSVLAFSPLPTVYRRPLVPLVMAFSLLPTVRNWAVHADSYRGFLRFRHYLRYKIAVRHADRTVGFGLFAITNGTPPVARTVGLCVFAITHGRKSLSGTPPLPWVFAFLPLPTVQNRCQVPRPYRGFSRFCRYPRYEIELSPPIPTVGFRLFTITHGMPPFAPTVGTRIFAITHGIKKPPPGRRI